MDVHLLGWIGLAFLVLALLTVDFVGHVRTPHAPTMREAATWSAGYVSLAALFGVLIGVVYGWQWAGQYYAGWITEWSLSLDNLFVFVIIIAAFRVPRELQQKVLLVGITFALVLRFFFIMVGSALVNQFAFVFYFFGAFLIYTAVRQAMAGSTEEDDDEYKENRFTRVIRKVFPVTSGFIGAKMIHRHGGQTALTPLFLVIVAVGSADLMFAVDSIPAIFGLTKEPFLVFAANAFSLLGLRQLYFLIDGLLERLVYLHFGLAAILGFIGAKLIIHALHENTVWFINGGHHWDVIPEPSISVSLGFIIVVLIITTVASLIKSRKTAREETEQSQTKE